MKGLPVRTIDRGVIVAAHIASVVAAQGAPEVSALLVRGETRDLDEIFAAVFELRKTSTVDGYLCLLDALAAGSEQQRAITRIVLPEVIGKLRTSGLEVAAPDRVAWDLYRRLCDAERGVNDDVARLWLTLQEERKLRWVFEPGAHTDFRESQLQSAWRHLAEDVLPKKPRLEEAESALSSMGSDHDPRLRMLAAWSIGYLAGQTSPEPRADFTPGGSVDLWWARDIVLSGIADPSPGTRRTAVAALASIDGAWAGYALGLALREPDDSMRIAVVRSLWARWLRGEQGGVNAELWRCLDECVQPDAPVPLRMVVLTAIGELATQWTGAVDALILKVLRGGDFDDLRAAASSIAKLPCLSPELAAELRRIVEKDDVRVLLAADALAEHHDLTVEATLLRLAASDDPMDRRWAMTSLAKLGPGVGTETWQWFVTIAQRGDDERPVGWEGLLRCGTTERLAALEDGVVAGLETTIAEDDTLVLPALLLASIRKARGEAIADPLVSIIAIQCTGVSEWLVEKALQFALDELTAGSGTDWQALEETALAILRQDQPPRGKAAELALQCLAALRQTK